jgi:hypothetical protein
MPVSIQVDVKFAVSVPRTPEVMAWMRTAMQKSVASILKRAQQNISGRFLRVRSGAGLASLRTSVRQSRDAVVGSVGSSKFYLRILHTGFPAQKMTTTKEGFLIRSEGKFIRVKSIQHPGVAPRPWLATAAQESREDILTAFDEVPAQIARFIARGRAA